MVKLVAEVGVFGPQVDDEAVEIEGGEAVTLDGVAQFSLEEIEGEGDAVGLGDRGVGWAGGQKHQEPGEQDE